MFIIIDHNFELEHLKTGDKGNSAFPQRAVVVFSHRDLHPVPCFGVMLPNNGNNNNNNNVNHDNNDITANDNINNN